MGAWMTERTAKGKTAKAAFASAVREAAEYSGSQDGYSGDLNSGGYGFVPVNLPGRCSLEKFMNLLEEAEGVGGYEIESAREDIRNWTPGGFFNKAGNKRGWKGQLAKAQKNLAKIKKDEAKFVTKVEAAGFYFNDFQSLARVYNDKWDDYLCVELSAHLAKKRVPHLYNEKKRGERIFVFFGYSPC